MLKDARGSGHSAVVSPASRAPVPQHPAFLQDPAHPTVTWPHFSRPCSLALPCGSFPGNWALHGAQTNLGFSGRPPLGGPWTFLSFDCSDCRIIPTVALCSGGPSSAPSSGGSCLRRVLSPGVLQAAVTGIAEATCALGRQGALYQDLARNCSMLTPVFSKKLSG